MKDKTVTGRQCKRCKGTCYKQQFCHEYVTHNDGKTMIEDYLAMWCVACSSGDHLYGYRLDYRSRPMESEEK